MISRFREKKKNKLVHKNNKNGGKVMKIALLLFFMIVGLILSGCAGMLNPYGEEFSCPKTYKGKCVSIQRAYEESLDPNFKEPEDKSYRYELNKEKQGCSSGNCDRKKESTGVLSMDVPGLDPDRGNGAYFDSLYKKMSSLLKEPTTPVIVPPKIMRVLIFSYTGDDEDLFMPRYVYFMADKPKWVVLDPALTMEESN